MRLSFALAALVVLAAVLGAGATAAAGQPDPENSTDANASVDVDVSGDEQEYLQELDSETRVVGWEYRDGTMYVELEADARRTVTMTEHVDASEGVTSGTITQHRIPEGTTTVSIDVERINGEAQVALTTPQSIREENYVVVSTGRRSITWFDGPASWDLVYIAVAVVFLATFGGTWRYYKKSEHEQDERQVEVIA